MKWIGNVGFAQTVEHDGIWDDEVIVKKYTGDLLKKRYDFQGSGEINDNITINHQLSILADKFMYDNFQCIKYVEVMGTRWKLKSVEVQYPRLILSLGGVWNGETDEE
ncbi:MAG: hypothetical protein J6Y02_07450 [Pseudobutyrivibrio sp.]|nr:hypothetical protein [Pseudobutyrivibrio sp.]